MKNRLVNCLESLIITSSLVFDIYAYYEKNYAQVLNCSILLLSLVLLFTFTIVNTDNEKSNTYTNILSIIFSFFYTLGYSYLKVGSAKLVFGRIDLFILSFISAIGYFLIFSHLLKYIFKIFEKSFFKKNIKLRKIGLLFEKYPFITSLILILICWLIYVIAFYPAILTPDSSFQIRQFFGIWTKYNEYSVMIDNNILITNHHPIIHTLLLGSCLKIGHLLCSDNFGLFLCSLIQIIFLSSVFSYSIKYLKKINISNRYRLIVLIIYALCPVFPMYAMTLVKDVIFAGFILLFITYLHKVIIHEKINYAIYILILIGVFLFRNNGYHVLVFTFLLMFIFLCKRWKFILINLIFVVFCSLLYNKVVLPYFRITPGSIREVLSLPFQQMARYYKYYADEMTLKDLKTIDHILDISDLGKRYNPEISDPVKNKFNKFATNNDLTNYFKVWFKCFFKHPEVYLDATLNNTYGYFYPEKSSWYIYYKFDKRIVQNNFNYHYNHLNGLRKLLSSMGHIFPNIPIIGLIVNIAINVWFLFIMLFYCLSKKIYRNIVILLPAFGLVLVCILSPVNCYFRYALPYVFSMPIMFGLFIHLCQKKENIL